MNSPKSLTTDQDRRRCAERLIIDRLSRRAPRAQLVADLVLAGRRSGALTTSDITDAIAALRDSGEIVVVEHQVDDPHLQGAILDVAALVEGDDDPIAQSAAYEAERAAETVWSQWLAQYLSAHRCE